jgi:catechol 2,3-dioxygenase-like lactoylglutathione lyase family enzyme
VIGSVEHMAIAAKDTAGLARWYVENLGFEVVVDGGSKGIWFVGPPGQGATLEIIPASDAARGTRARNDAGWSHLAFTVADVKAAYEALKAKGITFTAEPREQAGGSWLAFFADGEGNDLQIIQRAKPLR